MRTCAGSPRIRHATRDKSPFWNALRSVSSLCPIRHAVRSAFRPRGCTGWHGAVPWEHEIKLTHVTQVAHIESVTEEHVPRPVTRNSSMRHLFLVPNRTENQSGVRRVPIREQGGGIVEERRAEAGVAPGAGPNRFLGNQAWEP